MCSPAPRYCLSVTSARGVPGSGLSTSDIALASRWLSRRIQNGETGDVIAVLVDGVDRGARIAARLMSLSPEAVAESIRAETKQAA